jgi:hypothetical protein
MAVDRWNLSPGDCWEAHSSLMGGRQRDPSGAAGVIDYALSYGTVHVACSLYDKQSLSLNGGARPHCKNS